MSGVEFDQVYLSFLALGMTVNFPPWVRFFDFPFRSYNCFRKKIRLTCQKVFPLPNVGAPSASNSPSALSAQARKAGWIRKNDQYCKINLWNFQDERTRMRLSNLQVCNSLVRYNDVLQISAFFVPDADRSIFALSVGSQMVRWHHHYFFSIYSFPPLLSVFLFLTNSGH